MLRVDAGRRCSSGDGHFFFDCSPSNGQPVEALVSQIRQLALEAKQRVRQYQAAREAARQRTLPSNTSTLSNSGPSDQSRPPPVPPKCAGPGVPAVTNGRTAGRCSEREGANTPVPGEVEETEIDVGAQTPVNAPAMNGDNEIQQQAAVIKRQQQTPTAVDETDGVFIASPGRAVSYFPLSIVEGSRLRL